MFISVEATELAEGLLKVLVFFKARTECRNCFFFFNICGPWLWFLYVSNPSHENHNGSLHVAVTYARLTSPCKEGSARLNEKAVHRPDQGSSLFSYQL